MDNINENDVATSTGDVAIQPSVIGTQHRGIPCFNIDCENTFIGMSRGLKTKFKHWRKMTQSAEISNWVKRNKGSFYLHKDDRYILIKR